jgi:hypothetical protein
MEAPYVTNHNPIYPPRYTSYSKCPSCVFRPTAIGVKYKELKRLETSLRWYIRNNLDGPVGLKSLQIDLEHVNIYLTLLRDSHFRSLPGYQQLKRLWSESLCSTTLRKARIESFGLTEYASQNTLEIYFQHFRRALKEFQGEQPHNEAQIKERIDQWELLKQAITERIAIVSPGIDVES